MRRIVVTLTLGLLAFGAWPALAQQGQSSIQGRVVDESNAALPGVVVVATHQASGMFRQVVSNPDGSYYMTGVLPGSYRITAELPGFQKFERAEVLLQIGTTTTLDIAMKLSGIQENVTVTGVAPLVDVTSKQVGANISQEELAALPILNKNWMFAVSLAPGVQIQSNPASFACDSLIVSGGSNRSGNFSVDGGGNNDDYLGSACGSQVRTALEAVQEFQVLTNQYDAEFGRTAGAVINAITKQGTNSFHGALFGSYTNDKVTARDFFVAQSQGAARPLPKPRSAQKDWGGTIGGPIVKDRAHFFYSLDRLVFDEGRSNTFAARPELNYTDTQSMRLWNHMIRVDHQINASNTWSGRYLSEIAPTYNRISARRTLANKDQEYDVDRSAGGHWNTIFGNTRFNTIRAGWTYEKNGFTVPEVQGKNPVLMVDVAPTLTMLTFVDGRNAGALFRINDAYEISDTFSQFIPDWAGGDHDLKFGAQYIYSNIWLPDQSTMNGNFAFSTDRIFNAADPATYPERLTVRVPGPSDIKMPTHVAVLFAQDKWHRGNLTLNLGVRYDLEINPIDNTSNPFFTDSDYAVDKDNIAARTGFAYQLGGRTTSLFRGGYGLFYDKVTLITTTPFVSQPVFSSSFNAAFPNDRADAGPSNGRFPTDPMLVNGPVVNRALLNSLYPPGSVARNTGIVFLDTPDREVPKVHQVTLGYQRQLAASMALNVDYVKSWNRDQLINFDLNPAQRVNTTRTGALAYTDLQGLAQQLGVTPFRNQVLTRRNIGSSDFDGVNFQLEKRYSDNWAARVSYAIGYARGNAEPNQLGNNDYQVQGDPLLDLNFGPLDNDRQQNFVVSGRVELPGTRGLTVSGVYRWMTGTPLNLYNSAVDADRNGRLFDPIPAGRYCGAGTVNVYCTDNKDGRNGGRGPSYKQGDLRFGYRLRPGGGSRTLDVNFELFNVFNTVNFANPTSDMRLSDFLVLTALRGGSGQPRAAQIGVRLGF
jgi:hypothetical protein